MSGFLARLGAQAIGAAPVVKPRRPARFEPVDGPVGDTAAESPFLPPDESDDSTRDTERPRILTISFPGESGQYETRPVGRRQTGTASSAREPLDLGRSALPPPTLEAAAPPRAALAHEDVHTQALEPRMGPLPRPSDAGSIAPRPTTTRQRNDRQKAEVAAVGFDASVRPSTQIQAAAPIEGVQIDSRNASMNKGQQTRSTRPLSGPVPSEPDVVEPSARPTQPPLPIRASVMAARSTDLEFPLPANQPQEQKPASLTASADRSLAIAPSSVEHAQAMGGLGVDAPIVEVHIGRIDVAASPAPPQTSRGRARGIPTLAEYLAKSRRR